ncbi:MAG: mechanosensitive ion channel family protein [Crocinitomicaceae bacterium]|nr:mechanosensitive ion channel family protein [Crocinitomicaceae bacterium]
MEFWETEYYGNTVLEYAICLGIILGSVIAAKILYWLSSNVIKKLTKKTKTKLDDIIVDKIEEPVMFGLVLAASWYALLNLNYPITTVVGIHHETGDWVKWKEISPAEMADYAKHSYSWVRNFIRNLFNFLIVINVTWLIARLLDALIEEYIVPITEKSKSDLDDQLLPIVRKGLKIIIWTLGIVVGLNNAGYNVGAVIAGLGIGGLAFALAAQDTVKNFFGGIMIFADKPFQVGERIQIGGIDGTVKEIGIRSTRIETLAGRIVTVPNSKFSDDAVENVDLEPTRKVVLNLGLIYDTTAEQMEQAMQILREIHTEHKNNDFVTEDMHMGFNSFGDFSLGIIVIYYIKKGADILETQTKMNLTILKRFNEAGLEMAFPTQTIYHQQMK